jgi:8-oxo-dGTP diphosphatase
MIKPIKEQIGKELLDYGRWYRDSCAFSDNPLVMGIEIENRASRIFSLIEQDKQQERKSYVLGFYFNLENTQVALIQKNRPDWQRGRLNGIGGHIEMGEGPDDAMNRESKEEAGIDAKWNWFCTMQFEDCNVFCYACSGDITPETMTDEVVGWYPVNNLPDNVIPNLKWLIPMALSKEEYMNNVITSPSYQRVDKY